MNPELLELLNRPLDELTDEELTALREGLVAVGADVDPATASGEDIAALTEAADNLELVDAESERRATAAAASAAEAQAQLDRIAAHTAETQPEADPDADGDAGDEGGAETTQPEAAPEPAAEADAEGEPEPVEEAIAASARPSRPAVSALARRRPATAAPRPTARTTDSDGVRHSVFAAGDVRGVSAGTELRTMEDVAKAFVHKAEAIRYQQTGEMYQVATIRKDYPEERRLSSDDAALSNRRMDAVVGEQALVASGGLCAPLTPLYDQVQIAGDDRRVPQNLARFMADRGGMRWVPPPRLGNFDAGVSVWDVATDTTPNGATKPCVRVDCAAEQSVTVEAIPVCLTLGNFFARTFDERVQAIIQLLSATEARFTESRLLTKIGGGSTQVDVSEHLGATRDLLAGIELAAEGYRNRWRIRDGVAVRLALPEWVLGLMRVDLIRQFPGDNTLAVTDDQLTALIRACDVEPWFFRDGEAGQIFTEQHNGPLEGWPSTVIGYLYHEGAWVYLDGGEINLGVVRDSTLNSTNDLQIWRETFENVAFRGIQSERLTFDVCPDGVTSGSTTISVCGTGS